MASINDVVIALVPGSFATTVLYDKVVPLLEEAGYQTRGIELLSANEGTIMPAVQMEDDAAEIRKQLLEILDGGNNVVLCLQSYAGIHGVFKCTCCCSQYRNKSGADVGRWFDASGCKAS